MSGSSSTISTVDGGALTWISASGVVVKEQHPFGQLLHGHAPLRPFGRANLATEQAKTLAATEQTFASSSHAT